MRHILWLALSVALLLPSAAFAQVTVVATHWSVAKDPAQITTHYRAFCTLDGNAWVFDMPNAVAKTEAAVQTWVVANVADGTLAEYRDSGRRLRPPPNATPFGNSLDHAPRGLRALLKKLVQNGTLTRAEARAIITAWQTDGN